MMRASIASVAAFAAVLFAGGVAAAQDYPLSAQDRVSLRVVEWLPAQATYKQWDALAGEYVVRDDGTLAVPLVGSVEAAGRSQGDVAAEVSQRLQEQLGLSTRPDSTLEIVAYAPVFVLGDVATPGRVDFQPRLTALQAVGAAGGYYREGATQLSDRDAIGAEGSLRLAELTAARAAARLSRLSAEFEGATEIAVPVEFSMLGITQPDRLMAEERQIMEIRAQTLQSRLSSTESLRDLLSSRIQTLHQQMDNLDRQVELAQEELDGVTTLLDRGLATTQRSNALQRTLAEYEGRRLELESTALDVSRQLNEAERTAIDLRTDFRSEVATEMQTARSNLDEALTQVSLNSALLVEATTRGSAAAGRADEDAAPRVIFYLSRNGEAAAPVEITADTELRSGDVLDVRVQVAEVPSMLPTADAAPVVGQ
jgi:protein involved in polysaccharide export with SLBB domain